VRVVTFLERMGTPDANKLLLRIVRGGGVPAGRAADALVRIKDREKAPVNQPQKAIAEAEAHTAKAGGP
jgi:ethanolamine ammonia-lyase small subunit